MQARSNKDVLKPFNDRLDEILCLPYPYSKREPVRISRDVRLRSAYSDHEERDIGSSGS
jgi:hypothetical protein